MICGNLHQNYLNEYYGQFSTNCFTSNGNEEIDNESDSRDDETNTSVNNYYQNCIIDVILRLFAGSMTSDTNILNERLSMVMKLLELSSDNAELIKQFVWISNKINGLQKTVQKLYCHLSINLIGDEKLWIL